MNPLVSVICLSYNHEKFIVEALLSIINQTYSNIEIIIVDDSSEDDSQIVIQKFIKDYPHIKFISLEENIGNCKAFNLGFNESQGKYIVDFALDDVFLPTRIEKQVETFESLPPDYGVIFSDVTFINEKGKIIGHQYKRDKAGKLIENISQGNVYKALLGRYFISPPSMLVRREVIEKLGGYDVTLAYEDFDFWVRSSREFKYYFIDEVQTKKRVLQNSLGSRFSKKREYKMMESTFRVCEKAFLLNRNEEENEALATRIRFHMRQALFTENFSIVKDFYNLLNKTTKTSVTDLLWVRLANLRVPLFWIYGKWRK